MEISDELKRRLTLPGPKRILSLDGGGIRGAITLGFLEQIEKTLAERHKDICDPAEFRLHHYFDLIGGTSTGAIIAALLAIGDYRVAEIKKMYLDLGRKIFSDRHGLNLLGKRIYVDRKYDSVPLKEELKEIFGDAVLGDRFNKTGFCAVTKRLDTCSTWPVTNNPLSPYFARNRFFIRDIVRASTAAPSYFEPELIDVGGDEPGIFVDGGLSMMNNPSLQLFMVATLRGYNLRWQQGDDQLFIVSVGTGRKDKLLRGARFRDPKLWDIARFAPDQLMNDAAESVELMMHFIGKGTGPLRKIDRDIGDLSEDLVCGKNAFSYLRYNVNLDQKDLQELGGATFNHLDEHEISDLMEMDMPKNVGLLTEIGEYAGRKYVSTGHFPATFDLREISTERIQKER